MNGEKRRLRLVALGRSFVLFWLVSLAWIIPLSRHEGKPVFSTAGAYSHNYAGPASPGHLADTRFIQPPFEEAYTAWLNPAHQLDNYDWQVFGSRDNFNHQYRIIVKNLRAWGAWISDAHFVKLAVLLVCITLLLLYGKEKVVAAVSPIKPWLLVLLLYPLGYLPFFIENRYLLVEPLLIYLLLFYLLQESLTLPPRFSRRVLLIPVLAAAALPVQVAARAYDYVKERAPEYRYSYALYNSLPGLEFLQHSRIISDRGAYVPSLEIGYRWQAGHYGIWSTAAQDSVQQCRVQYLLASTAHHESYLWFQKLVPLPGVDIYVYKFE